MMLGIFRNFRRALLAIALTLAWAAPPANAQASAVAEAGRLRDAGDFAAAATVLTRHIAAYPSDSEAARMLAQTLYWMGDVETSTAAYEAALARFPGDARLRLEFARMLAETGRTRRVREVLLPLRNGAGGAEAEALRGTIAYWDGDLTGARRHLQAALRLDPAHAEAERQLREILTITAPRARIFYSRRDDAQPLDRSALEMEAAWYATPLQTLTLGAVPQRYQADHATANVTTAEAEWKAFWPRARLETELAAGALQRSFTPEADWTGRGSLGLRLTAGLVARGTVERAPYFWTVASLDTAVMTESAGGALEWDRRGWLGQAGYTVQRFPDDNEVQSAFAWVLAPLLNRGSVRAGIGYGFNAQDAAESRFVPAVSVRQPGNRPPPADTAGRYAPYYTPEQLRAHSVIGSLAAGGGLFSLSANGAYGVAATEQAPFALIPAGLPGRGAADLGFEQRSFHPWNARATVNAALTPALTLAVQAEHLRTAFYESTTVGAGLTYRFTRWALRGLPPE